VGRFDPRRRFREPGTKVVILPSILSWAELNGDGSA
jgi:hypothetical protein